jgi:glycosyltransferase involved in cell wall biosynthesis
LGGLVGPLAGTAEVVHPIIATLPRLSSAEAGFLRHRLGLSGYAALVGFSTTSANGETELSLRAARRVLEDLGNVEFVMIGQGSGLSACEELVHELGLGGATVFAPPARSVAEVISVLNVLVVMGETGGVCVDALQALQLGVPLITRRTTSMSDILPLFPQTMILEETTVEGLAETIAGALHGLPQASGITVSPAAMGDVSSLAQSMGQERVWNLGESWERSDTPTPTEVQILALREYGREAVVERLRHLYRKALSTQ